MELVVIFTLLLLVIILTSKEALIQSLSDFAISIMAQDKEKGDANSESYLRSLLTPYCAIMPQNQILRLNQWFLDIDHRKTAALLLNVRLFF